jgi:hypothetical protein
LTLTPFVSKINYVLCEHIRYAEHQGAEKLMLQQYHKPDELQNRAELKPQCRYLTTDKLGAQQRFHNTGYSNNIK